MSERGAARSLTFTATEEMVEYVCTVHPTTMVGDMEVSAGTAADGTATPTDGAGTSTGTPSPDAGFDDGGEGTSTDVGAPGE
ncbi:hypothetical protein [Halosimplex halophilum]|uniref:hypothetical protein n=1 Tax=Halosimplex halophilum TaxID=2559572 RepID=UPI00107F5E5D|nr:hypothetical protein [Halosimplex halophilum]